jgi:hypothetical protein
MADAAYHVWGSGSEEFDLLASATGAYGRSVSWTLKSRVTGDIVLTHWPPSRKVQTVRIHAALAGVL